ncbi:RagB/SusD family nutrient uptake outer membrane protein [Prolixibacter denitrificans]|uniref:Carbohydrate-binding protein n=1 Tax=Prolixibacter denitrificans TaxID=1541063 RepID=A0A2P8CCU8_9BACT|nr:RagB/SusD family nutrient uptake outer membrane protein [Prolixibacter denitrificans]PSK82752.1 putative outer membrane starch-binding protein [Prolixibacter denitrificans]GET21428.1 carbohydrate-binding protein [Prolixibacter denitrificans]
MKSSIIFLVLVLFLSSCDDLFDPAIENIRGLDAMYKEPTYAQGVLANAYILLPYSSTPNSDVATDDAVSNDNSNNYLMMATGSWTAANNPMSQWQDRRNAIQYLNLFLSNADQVEWSKDEVVRTMYNDRLKGEAYGLRAVQMYYLLLAHGGWTEDGRLLGFPIVTQPEDATSDFNQNRNTFQECVDQIFADAKKAIELLPLDYGNVADDQVPQKYKDLGVTNASDYNRVNGNLMRGRITGRIVEAVRAQVALLAASPSYSAGTNVTWEDAANYAATVLDRIGDVGGMDPNGDTWYANISEIEALASGVTPAEIIWRSDVGQSNTLETDNFPPSLYGSGRINPTQNLVNAFPMENGYPISDQSSNYDPANPYANRDPRLSNYVVFNESTQGPNNDVIVTGTYGDNNDAINRENGLSTRTGYYLRKLLRYDCNPDPQYNTEQKHYTARIRYTEIFLDYAEAANEAWGPTGTGSHTFSAYDVVKAIRARAGVGTANNDAYLESVKGDQDKMRELIRNERRLELCFENHRFWDLRRWKVPNLNETATGIQIDNSNGTLIYKPIDVEGRDYKDYMYYGPIPYGEIQKWSNLEQNAGW